MSAHVFRTIGNDEWSRSLRAARARPNVVRQMIAQRIRDLAPGSRNFTAAGSAARTGGGSPRAESGGGEHQFRTHTDRTKATEPV